MTNFQEYLNFNDEESKERQLKIIDKINISSDIESKIKKIDKKIKLTIYAEPYCPDCRTLVPIIEKIVVLNENIDVEYIKREKLKEINVVNVIPTVFLQDVTSQKLILSEYPEELKKSMTDILKYEYRTGKYNEYLINYLVNALVEEN